MPRRKLDPASPFLDALEAWIVNLGAAKPSPATLLAYRRDVEGIGDRLAVLEDLGEFADVALADLERPALRAAFASWASDHAAASVRRAHSAWSSLFDFLVAEGVRDGNPMAAIPKPKTPTVLPRAIRARDAIGRLLRVATEPDARARQPWPARDLALVATFCVTGIRRLKPSPWTSDH